jgi:hypothetical protein
MPDQLPSGGVSGTPSLLPIPDPSALSTLAIDKAAQAERDYVNGQLDVIRERLAGIDKATIIFNDTLTRVPTDTDKAVGALKELAWVRFDAVDKVFEQNEKQQVRESTANAQALAAALSAAKELVSVQNTSNSLAIQKSESSTVETIAKLSELVDVNIKSLARELADVKDRVIRAESHQVGGSDLRTDQRASLSSIAAIIGAIVGILGIVAAIIAFTQGGG